MAAGCSSACDTEGNPAFRSGGRRLRIPRQWCGSGDKPFDKTFRFAPRLRADRDSSHTSTVRSSESRRWRLIRLVETERRRGRPIQQQQQKRRRHSMCGGIPRTSQRTRSGAFSPPRAAECAQNPVRGSVRTLRPESSPRDPDLAARLWRGNRSIARWLLISA